MHHWIGNFEFLVMTFSWVFGLFFYFIQRYSTLRLILWKF
jgi:hypothetical protein